MDWIRVSTKKFCPICEKPDWCLVSDDGSAAICARIQKGSRKKCGDAGWLHNLKGTPPTISPSYARKTTRESVRINRNFQALAKQYEQSTTELWLSWLSYTLGISNESLQRLGVGWSKKRRAWSFPMKDAVGKVSGIRLRGLNGHKFSEKESKEGLFIPKDLKRQDTLVICEGPTDTAALLDLGINAIGRPSCRGGTQQVVEFTKLNSPTDVLIISDNDAPGDEGAKELAKLLTRHISRVRVGHPPSNFKDVREWKNSGLRYEEIIQMISNNTPSEYMKNINRPDSFVPFPTKVLPEPLQSYVNQGADVIGCDTTYIILPLLSALAAAVGNSRKIELKKDWKEPSIIWTAIVGPSGSKKSPAIDFAFKSLFKIEGKALNKYQQDLGQYEIKLSEYERAKNQEHLEKPIKPIAKRITCSDVTVEALAPLLQANPRGLVLHRDELNGWIKSFDAYKGGKGGDSATWLQLHRAGRLLVDRKTGNSNIINVSPASVSVTGGIQSKILGRALGSEHFENGLAARLLVAMPPTQANKWNENEVNIKVEQRVDAIFEKLLELELEKDEDGFVKSRDIGLSEQAKYQWVDFYDKHAEEMAKTTDENIFAALSKLEGYAARIALVIHLVKVTSDSCAEIDPNNIDEASILAGIAIVRWFTGETRRVYAILGENDTEHKYRILSELIRKNGGGITLRELMRSSRKYPNAVDTKAALQRLIDIGWLKTGPPKNQKGGITYVISDDADRNSISGS